MGSFFFLSLSLSCSSPCRFFLSILIFAHIHEKTERNKIEWRLDRACLSWDQKFLKFFSYTTFWFSPHKHSAAEHESNDRAAKHSNSSQQHSQELRTWACTDKRLQHRGKKRQNKKEWEENKKKRFNQKEQYKCWTANKKKIYSKSKLIIKKIVSTNNKSKAQPTNETEEKIGLYILEIKIHETRETNR